MRTGGKEMERLSTRSRESLSARRRSGTRFLRAIRSSAVQSHAPSLNARLLATIKPLALSPPPVFLLPFASGENRRLDAISDNIGVEMNRKGRERRKVIRKFSQRFPARSLGCRRDSRQFPMPSRRRLGAVIERHV